MVTSAGRPAGPVLNSHVRQGVVKDQKMKTSAEGAEEDDAMEGWSVGPSGLRSQRAHRLLLVEIWLRHLFSASINL